MINVRKPVELYNRTNYFDPDKDKIKVRFASAKSNQSRVSKIEGYQCRLYWEFKYCQDHDGQTFYYTLTYNNKNLPRYDGMPCFDYRDLVYLLNGGFKKKLLRSYGTLFKYFVGAELGEGAGKRGMSNNPHYHVLFFLRPAGSDKYPYKKISPDEFRHLVRHYWQGFDQDTDGWHSFKSAKYGIAKEGKYVGLVQNYQACTYVSKYVTKDVRLYKFERSLRKELTLRYDFELADLEDTFNSFLLQVVYPKYATPSRLIFNPDGKYVYHFDDFVETPVELFSKVAPDHYRNYVDSVLTEEIPIKIITHGIIHECNLMAEYRDFFAKYVKDFVSDKVSEFRNVYSNKCRISHGVGDYALRFIDDPLRPQLKIPDKHGWKFRNVNLYYYRKLFTEVVKDVYGNPVRVLTPLGIEYKSKNLPVQILSLVNKTESYLQVLNKDLYNKIYESDVNSSNRIPYWEYKKLLNDSDKSLIINRYAEYKLVYEDRFFKIPDVRLDSSFDFPRIDPVADYIRFLQPSYFMVSYSPDRLNIFLEDDCKGYLSYLQHPYFLAYSRLFGVFDIVSDYLFCQKDKQKEEYSEKIRNVRKVHALRSLDTYYKQFN